MKFVPYPDLGDSPNLIVDGQSNPATVLNLSHWPQSGTPKELKDDLSAQIVFRYLDNPKFHVNVGVVSNDHFDEDGLVSLHTVINPEHAQRHRALLIDIASAGDFGIYQSRDAARAVFVISAYAEKGLSPLPSTIFEKPYPEMAADLYTHLLPVLPDIIQDLSRYRQWWQPEDDFLAQSEAKVQTHAITIEELPALDLAVVTIIDKVPKSPAHRFTQSRTAWCHPMAINNATNCFRIMLVHGRQYELQFRYESWVQYISRKPLPRVDLTLLADRLTQQESGGIWKCDNVGQITPGLYLTNADESRIAPEEFRHQVMDFLAEAPPAWNPYD